MPNILTNLNPIQQQAVVEKNGRILILAGAGSGKTRVLTYKVAYLISQGVSPGEILMVTFTNKAAGEMKKRVWELLGNHIDLPFMGTFHSFCAQILRKIGGSAGIEPNYLIFDQSDSLSLIKKILRDLNLEKSKPGAIQHAISSAKNELLTPEKYSVFANDFFTKIVARVYSEYQKRLKVNNALDFDDLIFKTCEILENFPKVAKIYQQRFKYVLIDEYQDVNLAQYKFSKLISSYHKNLTVVGDAAQAIYGFRGADFRNILNFSKDFPDTKVFNLEQNYRSSKKILTAANAIISKNTSHPTLNLWTQNSDGEEIKLIENLNEIDEAETIVNIILNSNLPLSSFAVLYRTNAQSRVLEEQFLKYSIPYILVGGVRFYDRKEVKDAISYLRYSLNPADEVALGRIIKLGKRRFEKFTQNLKKIDLDQNTVDLLNSLLIASQYLLLIDDGTEVGQERVENVKELLSLAQNYPDPQNFLQNVALTESESRPLKKLGLDFSEAVVLSTVHAAKGLEFETVFIIGMEEGLFPHSRSLIDPTEIEEERRLAYVGVTRAKEKLILLFCRQRLFLGQRDFSTISRFILDIPENLLLKLTSASINQA